MKQFLAQSFNGDELLLSNKNQEDLLRAQQQIKLFFLSYSKFYKFIIEERRKELKLLLLFRMMEFAIHVNRGQQATLINLKTNSISA